MIEAQCELESACLRLAGEEKKKKKKDHVRDCSKKGELICSFV